MKKEKKPLFREQIPGIINKLVQIDQNSPDTIFLSYNFGGWEANIHIGGYDSNKDSEHLIEDDYLWKDDKDRKAAYAKALDYIKKNEGKYICLMNLRTGDKVYYGNKKAIVGTIIEGRTDFSIVETGEVHTILWFNKDETYFKTW